MSERGGGGGGIDSCVRGVLAQAVTRTRNSGTMVRMASPRSRCAIEAVPRIAEAGEDEAALVETSVNGGGVDRNLGELRVDAADALGRCHDTEEAQVANARL